MSSTKVALINKSFQFTESRILSNRNFEFQLAGYFAVVNISSNNFTSNRARDERGIVYVRGMEKVTFYLKGVFHLQNSGIYNATEPVQFE
jgi:hypothetical protein